MTELLSTTAFKGEIEPNCVEVKFVQDIERKKKFFTAHVVCPACEKLVTLAFTKYLSPVLHNFKRHVTSIHLIKADNKKKEVTGQKSITELFDQIASKNASKASSKTIESEVDVSADDGE